MNIISKPLGLNSSRKSPVSENRPFEKEHQHILKISHILPEGKRFFYLLIEANKKWPPKIFFKPNCPAILCNVNKCPSQKVFSHLRAKMRIKKFFSRFPRMKLKIKIVIPK